MPQMFFLSPDSRVPQKVVLKKDKMCGTAEGGESPLVPKKV